MHSRLWKPQEGDMLVSTHGAQVVEMGRCPIGEAGSWEITSPMGRAGPQVHLLLSGTCAHPAPTGPRGCSISLREGTSLPRTVPTVVSSSCVDAPGM